jgi:hypothetical protein
MARTKPPLKLRRGTQAEILAAFASAPADFALGEPIFATDTGKLYIKNAAGTLDEISGGGGGVWGAITGTLSNQTDLSNALATKVDLADLPQTPEGDLDLAQESTLLDLGNDIDGIDTRVTALENAPDGVDLSSLTSGDVVKVSTVGGVKVLASATNEQNTIESLDSLMFSNTGEEEGYLKFVPSGTPGLAGSVSFAPAILSAPEFIDGGGADADNPT